MDSLTPRQHIVCADNLLQSADSRELEPEWVQAEAELAQAHLIAAGIKLATDMLGVNSRPNVVGMIMKLVK